MAHIVNFALDPEADRDIVRWLKGKSNRSAAIRAAIRAAMAEERGATLDDVLAEIRALPSKLRVVAATPEMGGDEPEAAAANLNGLLDRLNEEW